ncbi:MAG: hypothetical protein U9Q98_05485 [Bacteroidota bacterium]|nr:hypothetical protein [Bacteroidota bacterium]
MYGYLNHIPKPFLLNPWKHHLGYIQDNISALQKLSLADVRRYMLDIGESVTDVYTGKLSVPGICSDLETHLKHKGIFEKNAYLSWIETVSMYEVIPVSDNSRWLMRQGNDERYIHIHPGKISPHKSRFKSQQIKTALLYAVYADKYEEKSQIKIINKLRQEFLDLPPLNHTSDTLSWLITCFTTREKNDKI